jgi:hypothetical protein
MLLLLSACSAWQSYRACKDAEAEAEVAMARARDALVVEAGAAEAMAARLDAEARDAEELLKQARVARDSNVGVSNAGEAAQQAFTSMSATGAAGAQGAVTASFAAEARNAARAADLEAEVVGRAAEWVDKLRKAERAWRNAGGTWRSAALARDLAGTEADRAAVQLVVAALEIGASPPPAPELAEDGEPAEEDTFSVQLRRDAAEALRAHETTVAAEQGLDRAASAADRAARVAATAFRNYAFMKLPANENVALSAANEANIASLHAFSAVKTAEATLRAPQADARVQLSAPAAASVEGARTALAAREQACR